MSLAGPDMPLMPAAGRIMVLPDCMPPLAIPESALPLFW